jgi:hypothetical protein
VWGNPSHSLFAREGEINERGANVLLILLDALRLFWGVGPIGKGLRDQHTFNAHLRLL